MNLPPDDRRHGSNGYGNLGCRCEVCTAANTAHHRKYMASHSEQRAKAAAYNKEWIQRPESQAWLEAYRQTPERKRKLREAARARRGVSEELSVALEVVWKLRNEAAE